MKEAQTKRSLRRTITKEGWRGGRVAKRIEEVYWTCRLWLTYTRCRTEVYAEYSKPVPLSHIHINTVTQCYGFGSVGPYVFGPPGSGSGSVCQRYGSEYFYHQAKNLEKHWFLLTSLWLFILENDLNVPSKSNTQTNLEKISFLMASWRSMTIAGSGAGYISQRHGSPIPPYPSFPPV